MGLFREFGRRVERLKREVEKAAADRSADCPSCGEPLPADKDSCPSCGEPVPDEG